MASRAGRSFTLVKTVSWSITVPVKILTKNTFQIVKYKILQHALCFLALREIKPSTAENSIIIGGTAYKNRIKITLGK